MTKQAIHDMGHRLCQPKSELSYEEMQRRVFGKDVKIPPRYIAAAKRIEDEKKRALEQTSPTRR